MKKIDVRLTNEDHLEFIGCDAFEGGVYVVNERDSITTMLPQHILWIRTSGYIQEKIEGNVVHVAFKGGDR